MKDTTQELMDLINSLAKEVHDYTKATNWTHVFSKNNLSAKVELEDDTLWQRLSENDREFILYVMREEFHYAIFGVLFKLRTRELLDERKIDTHFHDLDVDEIFQAIVHGAEWEEL